MAPLPAVVTSPVVPVVPDALLPVAPPVVAAVELDEPAVLPVVTYGLTHEQELKS